MKFCQVLLITNKTVVFLATTTTTTSLQQEVTIKSFTIDDPQAVCCPNCGKSSGLEFDQNTRI